MDPNTTFTLSQVGTFILQFCTGIALIGTTGTWILKAVGIIRAPEKKQDATLEDHEARIKRLEGKVENDFHSITDMQEEMRILLTATLATIKHQLDGNDVDSLRSASKDIERYLINK